MNSPTLNIIVDKGQFKTRIDYKEYTILSDIKYPNIVTISAFKEHETNMINFSFSLSLTSDKVTVLDLSHADLITDIYIDIIKTITVKEPDKLVNLSNNLDDSILYLNKYVEILKDKGYGKSFSSISYSEHHKVKYCLEITI